MKIEIAYDPTLGNRPIKIVFTRGDAQYTSYAPSKPFCIARAAGSAACFSSAAKAIQSLATGGARSVATLQPA